MIQSYLQMRQRRVSGTMNGESDSAIIDMSLNDLMSLGDYVLAGGYESLIVVVSEALTLDEIVASLVSPAFVSSIYPKNPIKTAGAGTCRVLLQVGIVLQPHPPETN